MKENKIYIPKLSIGNTQSVVNMINRIGGEVVIANTPEDLLSSKKQLHYFSNEVVFDVYFKLERYNSLDLKPSLRIWIISFWRFS